MDREIELLKKCIENRAPILLLGAGFSLGAKGQNGENLVLGSTLAKELFAHIIEPNRTNISEENWDKATYAARWGKLQEVCDVLRETDLLSDRNRYFQALMSGCTFNDSPYYSSLLKVDWKYIFTLNVDDLVEHIFEKENKPLLCWKLSSERYEDDPQKTVLVKLHGDIGDPDTYVFDEKEYRSFSSRDNWMLRKFADLYISHDVIIVGTQFQEKDIEIALEKVFDYGCDNTNFNYFFISPGTFTGRVAEEIQNKTNFHHIKWTTEQLLSFLENDISKPKDAIQNLCSCGITYWNNELANAQSQKENWELFYGKPSEPRDFYYSVDIPRKIQMREIENFFSENSCGFIEIKGKPFVGKTCLAQRVLTNGVEQMFKVFYCQKTDLRVCQIVKQYLDTLTPDDSILLCFEDASGYYRPLVEMFERYKDGLNKLIIIMTSSDMTQGSRKYVFGSEPLLEIHLNERINGVFANSIYEKLSEKSQLGKLVNYADSRTETVKYMRQIDDFIDVLYIAHHGKRFAEYFNDWIGMRDEDVQFPVFQAVSLLTTMGMPHVSINHLPEICESICGRKFSYPNFIKTFGEFCLEENGLLRLRCSRLFTDVVLKALDITERVKIIRDLVYSLSKDLLERDRSLNNEMFKHLIRASSLTSIVGLEEKKAINFLIELQDSCKHLSYYWIQLGILYRNSDMFEEAENAFEYAKNAHGVENYQIAHTTAKNYMEWGVWSTTNAPSQAAALFEEGAKKMIQLLWVWKYPDAICFSAHAYIDMCIKYYRKLNQVPTESTWLAMNNCLENYIDNASHPDMLLKDVLVKMFAFAKECNLQLSQEKRAKKLLQQKSYSMSHGIVEWADDELPLYDRSEKTVAAR